MTIETVERLQISGCLMRMGGDVPRLHIQCDDGLIVEVSNVAPDKLAAMPMLLYNRVTLTVQAESEPAPAAAPEDAERAAYLKRWEGAPAEATHLWQAKSGECFWLGEWLERAAGTDLIGRPLVEPRPEGQP